MTSRSLHVAIIMDGNGRWATARGWPRPAGHRHGAEAVRRAVEAAPALGIATLTLFAFSADNWKRPPREVRALMGLFQKFLMAERATLARRGVRLSVIGRRDRLPASLVRAIAEAEAATAGGRRLHLRVAVDYSAREAILAAARRLRPGEVPTRETFTRCLAEAHRGGAPDVDLLIRTGGEQRLSDFLLWESAYAELCFTGRLWPDFEAADLIAAVADFHQRQRRFGALPGRATGRAGPVREVSSRVVRQRSEMPGREVETERAPAERGMALRADGDDPALRKLDVRAPVGRDQGRGQVGEVRLMPHAEHRGVARIALEPREKVGDLDAGAQLVGDLDRRGGPAIGLGGDLRGLPGPHQRARQQVIETHPHPPQHPRHPAMDPAPLVGERTQPVVGPAARVGLAGLGMSHEDQKHRMADGRRISRARMPRPAPPPRP
jgi:undecaprenyl diphosphate synthase